MIHHTIYHFFKLKSNKLYIINVNILWYIDNDNNIKLALNIAGIFYIEFNNQKDKIQKIDFRASGVKMKILVSVRKQNLAAVPTTMHSVQHGSINARGVQFVKLLNYPLYSEVVY